MQGEAAAFGSSHLGVQEVDLVLGLAVGNMRRKLENVAGVPQFVGPGS